MKKTPRSNVLKKKLCAWSCCAAVMLNVVCAVSADGQQALPDEEKGNILATLRMMATHEALRRPEVADPDAPENLRMLTQMIEMNLRQKSRPAPSSMERLPVDPAAWVGTLPVEVSTNNKGAFNVKIDFPTPKGRAGLAPDLGLYHGGGQYVGTAGNAFGLSTGFSSTIERGRTLGARDGVVAAPELGRSDRLYLDGKLLLCLGGEKKYGLPGSLYRTEVDSDVVVTALGKDGVITGFVSDNGKGWLRHYGVVGGETDALWPYAAAGRDPAELHPSEYALKRVIDRSGNRIDFRYLDRGGGEYTLEAIDFTGGVESAPYYRVEFTYKPSRRQFPQYAFGSRKDERYVLSEVNVLAGSNRGVIARYQLFYEEHGSALLDRLKQVEAWRAKDVGMPLVAVQPIRLRWSDLPPEDLLANSSAGFTAAKAAAGRYWVADVNNDGVDDLVRSRKRGLELGQWNQMSNEFQYTDWLQADGALTSGRWVFSDWSGDFRTDIACMVGKKMNLWRAGRRGDDGRAPAPAMEQSQELSDGSRGDWKWGEADRIGLGRRGIVATSAKGFRFMELDATGWQQTVEPLGCAQPGDVASVLRVWWFDFNSDGRDEPAALLARKDGAYELGYRLQKMDRELGPWRTLHIWKKGTATEREAVSGVLWGSSNGDGLVDLLIRVGQTNAGTAWTLLHNRSVSGISEATMAEQFVQAGTVTLPDGVAPSWVDLDHDWCDDLIWIDEKAKAGADEIRVRLGTGSGWREEKRMRAPGLVSAYITARKAYRADLLRWSRTKDFNADGAPDWVLERGVEGDQVAAIVMAPVANDHAPRAGWLTDVMDGMGCMKSVTYRPTNSDVVVAGYDHDLGPVVALRGQRLVVADRWNDEGTSKPSHFRYIYSGPRHCMAARGDLGFTSFTTFDSSTRMLKYQFLNMSFPMTGLTRREQTLLLEPVKDGWRAMMVSCKEHKYGADFTQMEDGSVSGAVVSPKIRELEFRSANQVAFHQEFKWSKDGDVAPFPSGVFWREILGGKPNKEQWTLYDRQTEARTSPELSLAAKTPWARAGDSAALWEDFTRFPRLLSHQLEAESGNLDASGVSSTTHKIYFESAAVGGAGPGLVRKHREIEKRDGKITKDVFFSKTYVSGKRLVEQEHKDEEVDGKPVDKSTHLMEYDNEGRMVAKFVRGEDKDGQIGWQPVFKTTAFDPALGLATERHRTGYYPEVLDYNRVVGDVRMIKSSNGWTGEYEYDGLGRDVGSRFKKDGKENSNRRYWTLPGGKYPPREVAPPAGKNGETMVSLYVEINSKEGETPTQLYFDRFGRRIATLAYISESDNACIDHVYNADGQEIFRSDPYPIKSKAKKWDEFRYDALGNKIGTEP
jgi:hypothetical protein